MTYHDDRRNDPAHRLYLTDGTAVPATVDLAAAFLASAAQLSATVYPAERAAMLELARQHGAKISEDFR